MSAPAPRVDVLYVAGCGRSGSTLLDLVLGRVPGLVSLGEVKFLWERGLHGNELCGCGAPFRECAFWRAVGEEAFGGWDAVDVERMLWLERRVDRHRYLPLILAPWLSRRYRGLLDEYAARLEQLYRAIATVSGAELLVDSTKHPSYALILRRIRGIRLRSAHIVRDGRGVAFSWSKEVGRPEVVTRNETMPRYGPARAAGQWLVDNLLVHAFGRRLGARRVGYERFVAAPRAELEALLAGLGRDPADAVEALAADDAVDLGENHTVAGNPLRFRRGRIQFSLDEEWRERMTRRDRAVVSLVAWPLLAAYHYRR